MLPLTTIAAFTWGNCLLLLWLLLILWSLNYWFLLYVEWATTNLVLFLLPWPWCYQLVCNAGRSSSAHDDRCYSWLIGRWSFFSLSEGATALAFIDTCATMTERCLMQRWKQSWNLKIINRFSSFKRMLIDWQPRLKKPTTSCGFCYYFTGIYYS